MASTRAPRLEQSLQAAKRPFKRYGAAFLKFNRVHTLPNQAEMWSLLGAAVNDAMVVPCTMQPGLIIFRSVIYRRRFEKQIPRSIHALLVTLA